jgi:AcrR family transcriptional regulator
LDRRNGNNGNGHLNRDLIYEVALDTIEQVGLEAMSMRTLATILGIKASSLYHHFASKEELMTGVAEFLYKKLGQLPPRDDWAGGVRSTFIQWHELIQEYPNASPLLVRDLARSTVAKERADVLLELMRGAGIDAATRVSLISNLVALLVGHTLLSVWAEQDVGSAGSSVGSGDGDGSDVWIRELLQVAPAESHSDETRTPSGEESGGPVDASTVAPPVDSIFVAGLDALISGFRSRLC